MGFSISLEEQLFKISELNMAESIAPCVFVKSLKSSESLIKAHIQTWAAHSPLNFKI